MVQPNPGAQRVTPLDGTELVDVLGVGWGFTTTSAIAALGQDTQLPPVKNTAITTAGNGTLTAAAIVGGYITRTGPTGAYSDATDTATNIVNALAAYVANESFVVSIKNATAFAQTITAGTGVTLPSAVIVSPQSVATYLVTVTAPTTVTWVHMRTTLIDAIPPAQFTTASLTAGTLGVGVITGAAFTVLTNTGATPGAQTVRTAAQMLADFPGMRVGDSYILRVVNTGAGTLTLTADAGPTVTLTGTATIAQNIFRDYIVTFNTATTATIQSIGSGVSP